VVLRVRVTASWTLCGTRRYSLTISGRFRWSGTEARTKTCLWSGHAEGLWENAGLLQPPVDHPTA